VRARDAGGKSRFSENEKRNIFTRGTGQGKSD
jgi:hypothetical protein